VPSTGRLTSHHRGALFLSGAWIGISAVCPPLPRGRCRLCWSFSVCDFCGKLLANRSDDAEASFDRVVGCALAEDGCDCVVVL